MNTLRSAEFRKKAAIATAAIAGMVGLTGCDISLSNPDMRPQDKAKFEKILKPAAVKAARRVVAFVRKDEKDHSYLSYVSHDYSVPEGYQVDISPLTSVGPDLVFRMKGHKENGKLVLEPGTTYYAEEDDLDSGKNAISSNTIISHTERGASVYKRKVWFAQSYFEMDKNGKVQDSALADTHVNSPRSQSDIHERLDYARSVAAYFAEGVADDLSLIEDQQNA